MVLKLEKIGAHYIESSVVILNDIVTTAPISMGGILASLENPFNNIIGLLVDEDNFLDSQLGLKLYVSSGRDTHC